MSLSSTSIKRPVLRFLGSFIPGMTLLVSILGLIGGIGLLSFQKWSRVFVMVIAAVGCLAIPVGTILGVYSLWVLLQDDTIKLFK